MKFSQFQYERPDMEEIKIRFHELMDRFQAAESARQQIEATYDIFDLRNKVDVMSTLASIRTGADVEDQFYDEEYQYCESIYPVFQGYVTEFMKAFTESKFRDALKEEFGEHLFFLYECQIRSYDDSIIKELQEESMLGTQYDKLIASAKVEFMGEVRNLSQLQAFMQAPDREIRKAASEKFYGFYGENMQEIDRIYDELVAVRTKMAHKSGYDSYTDMAYFKLSRDYTKEDAKRFRDAVLEYVVPVANDFREKQRRMIQVDALKYYDQDLNFKNGNARPKGDINWQLEKTKQMYSELSKETKEYIEVLLDRELYDLEGRQNKYSGAYCTWIPQYDVPFLYANANGTEADVNFLTHEAGHGFQTYQTMKYTKIPDYTFPSYDACEIHSTSMEFITWPWMKLFFEEDEKKYKYYHVTEGMKFIPYAVCVDEFQHEVYDHPELTPAQRRALWRDIEKKYMPYIDYDGNEFLENGGYWFRQSHIFTGPFYYLDYALAQICAYQFWMKCSEDREKGWNDYLRLCNAGGSEGLHKLLEIGRIESPFEHASIQKIAAYVEAWVDGFDFD